MSRPTAASTGVDSDRGKFSSGTLLVPSRKVSEVYPVNLDATEVEGVQASPDLATLPVARLDRVGDYVRPQNLIDRLDRFFLLSAADLWHNPRIDTPEVVARAESLAIRTCRLIVAQSHPGHP